MSLDDLSREFSIVRAPEAAGQLRAFVSVEEEIAAYAREDAITDELTNFARTYAVLRNGNCAGYFTLMADAIRLMIGERPGGVRYYSAPALKIARLGAHVEHGPKGTGRWMLAVITGLGLRLAEDIGLRYLTVDALPRPKLIEFYERHGFVKNVDENDHRMRTTGEHAIIADGEPPPELVVSMRLDLVLRPATNGTTSAGWVV